MGLFAGGLALGAQAARGEPALATSYTLYGTPGLIEMPTARMAEDGEFAATLAGIAGQTRATLTFQISPRLSGSFRYTKIADFYAPGPVFPNGEDLYDRSFDLRFQIAEEGRLRPAIAVGLQDFIGTGIYSSEYLVATKTLTPKLRASVGIGWGRLGSAGSLGAPFGPRPEDRPEEGGQANAAHWFRGDAALFGGIAYAPNDRLTLKAEYSSDAYAYEAGRGLIERDSPWNFGLDYRLRRNVHLQAAYMYGAQAAVSLTFALNPRRPVAGPGNEAAPLPVGGRPDRRADPLAWSRDWAGDSSARPALHRAIGEAMAADGLVLEALTLAPTRVELRYRNTRFAAEAQALGRTARILTRALPASVETFALVPVTEGVPRSRVILKRSDIEALEHAPASAMLARAAIDDAAGARPGASNFSEGLYPKFTWALRPYAALSFFDPDAPVRGDVGLRLSARYDVAPGWVVSGALRKRLAGNLAEIERESDSRLPHVRTDSALYAREGDPSIEHLTVARYGRPARNLYSRVTAGLLEPMFGGISGELLWKPVDSRLGLGVELNWAKQRDYDQLFSFRDYEVFTGHASAYYDFGNGYHGQLDLGRYLAGDWGATVTLDREFANGWRIGAYATFTDVSAEDFGEGSFDKGIRITVPHSFFTGRATKARTSTVLRPLTRDGGARLQVGGRLYEKVRDAHASELKSGWGRFWR